MLLPIPCPPGGVDKVAELTGRKGRLVKTAEGKVKYEARNATNAASMEMQNMHEKAQFMDGKKFVAIISEAASQGISLQADKRVKNQRPRVHLTLELPWSADKAVQQLGRTHRSNQSSGPAYKFLLSGVGGEKRFAVAVAKRLESLGALTQGDRRATVGAQGLGLSSFNMDTVVGKKALDTMLTHIFSDDSEYMVKLKGPSKVYKSIEDPLLTDEELSLDSAVDENLSAIEGDDANGGAAGAASSSALSASAPEPPGVASANFKPMVRQWLREVGVDPLERDAAAKQVGGISVARFLNRMLGLRLVRQRVLFDYFSTVFDAMMRDERQKDNVDDGISQIQGRSVRLACPPRRMLLPSVAEGEDGENAPEEVLWHYQVQRDRGMAWEEALKAEAAAKALAAEGSAAEGSGKTTGRKRQRKEASKGAASMTGFWIAKRKVKTGSRKQVLLAIDGTASKSRADTILVHRPDTGRHLLRRGAVRDLYRRVEGDAAKEAWEHEFERSGTTCLHGASCKRLPLGSCSVGKRISVDDVLAGDVLTIWQHAKSVASHKDDKLKVVRVIAGPPEAMGTADDVIEIDEEGAEEAEETEETERKNGKGKSKGKGQGKGKGDVKDREVKEEAEEDRDEAGNEKEDGGEEEEQKTYIREPDVCMVCRKSTEGDDTGQAILCDGCDEGEMHLECDPSLGGVVPKGKWFCPACVQDKRKAKGNAKEKNGTTDGPTEDKGEPQHGKEGFVGILLPKETAKKVLASLSIAK